MVPDLKSTEWRGTTAKVLELEVGRSELIGNHSVFAFGDRQYLVNDIYVVGVDKVVAEVLLKGKKPA